MKIEHIHHGASHQPTDEMAKKIEKQMVGCPSGIYYLDPTLLNVEKMYPGKECWKVVIPGQNISPQGYNPERS